LDFWLVLLLVGGAVTFAMAWRALLTVTRAFCGSFELRAGTIERDAAAGTWLLTTNDERQVLRHLANNRLVNCLRNSNTVEKLWKMRLLLASRGLEIADEETRKQARYSMRSKSEVDFEQAQNKGTWSEVRIPFFAVLGLAVIAVLVATPEALRSVMAVLAASAGGIGVIIQVASLMMRGKN
jgi:hypothetical protein